MLEITPAALEKLKEVMEEQGEKEAALRVIASPNGNGVQYAMTMETDPQKDDNILNLDGLKFVVDSTSAEFLEQATVDYVEDLTRVGFVINNPMYAAPGCACGNSSCGCGSGGCGSGH